MFETRSIKLLKKAHYADIAAEKSLVAANKLRKTAAAQRLLASRIESEENAVRLEKACVAADNVCTKASNAYQLAINECNLAEYALEAAKKNVTESRAYLDECSAKAEVAREVAQKARASVPTVKNEG